MTKDLNLENVSSTVENVLLPGIGWAGSGAVVALVPENRKKLVKGVMLGASIIVAAATQAGNKQLKSSTKVLSGVAIRQGMDLLQDALKKRYAITDASPASDKLIAGAIGLACPDGGCQYRNDALVYDAAYVPSLQMPEYDTVFEELEEEELDNSFA
ncbi:hypothetical protein U6A24_12655 [Aquimarina gracilis]|uniref:Uncharacterized protein n=1 Tax=Aquimarina gracilis TaxID=874422 RepID=A0ABU5ZWU3_9FLAO|nr:hypothetical protein [Aquimarina gracilis]MEB3346320.1 hypothetical protein [Aquimarina gracilis]